MLEQEQKIIKKFVDYIKDKWNIDLNNPNTAYNEVKQAFNYISNDSLPIIRLEKKIENKRRDYEDISKPYVRGESYGGYGGGAPINSFKTSYDENIHILRLDLEMEISDMAIEKQVLEKQLKEEFEIFENLTLLLSNPIQRQIMIMAYLEKRKYSDIALTLGYSYNTVMQYVSNGIRDIAKKIKQYRKI